MWALELLLGYVVLREMPRTSLVTSAFDLGRFPEQPRKRASTILSYERNTCGDHETHSIPSQFPQQIIAEHFFMFISHVRRKKKGFSNM
jgi:hypothetical protein